MSRVVAFISAIGSLSLGLVLASAAPSAAQSTATLQGTVTDTQAAVMPGVTLSIRNAATGIERLLHSSVSVHQTELPQVQFAHAGFDLCAIAHYDPDQVIRTSLQRYGCDRIQVERKLRHFLSV